MPAWCKQMTAASCCRRAAACFCGVEARPEAPASPSAQPLLHFNWHSPVAASQAFNLGSFQYHLKQPVGKGTHAVVWLCEVRGSSASESPPIALKLGPADVSSEAAALQCLDGGRGLFPSLLGQVRINGQKGLAMSLHGPSLYFVQRARGFRPFPMAFAWALAEQMLQALLSLNEIGMSHTDIKMQNIVLRQASVEASSELGADSLVTLVDLGSAMPCRQLREARPGSLYVQSRWYRAPEVMRGKPLCRAIDTWSIGCVLAEVVMGVPLFPGKDEDDMLDRICGVLDDGASAHATPLQLIRVISRSVWSGERGRNGASKGAEGTDSCTEAAAERRTKDRKEGCLEASRNGGSDGKGEIDKDSKWHGQESGEGVEDSVAAAADASAARARHGDSGEGARGGDAATAIKGNGVWDSAGRSPQESETEEQPGQTCVRALANEAEGVLGNASGDVKEDAEGSAAAECSERRVRDADALAQPTENWSGQLEPDNLALLLDSYVELYPEDRRSILEMLRSLLRMDPTRRATPEKALHILRVLSCQDKPTMTPLEEPEAVDQVPLRDRHEL